MQFSTTSVLIIKIKAYSFSSKSVPFASRKRLLKHRSTSLVTAALLLSAGCDSGVVVSNNNASTNQTNIAEFNSGSTDACIDANEGIVVCPASDMARITRTGAVPIEHPELDWSNGPLQLRAARNETIAFQLVLRTSSTTTQSNEPIADKNVSVVLQSFVNTSSREAIDRRVLNQSAFTAFYHPIDNAGYEWGPPTTVLPWPDEYPDALVPSQSSCNNNRQIDAPVQVELKTTPGTNQAVWIDTYISQSTPPGKYSQNIQLSVGSTTTTLPIEITVYDVVLPDKPSIDAVGELYRSYFQEGAGFDVTQPEWRAMAQCYQQLAHQHRMVFIERLPALLTPDQFDNYVQTIAPSLSGELFSVENGYIGPGANTPVALWRTPWPQTIDGVTSEAITETQIQSYRELAAQWDTLVTAQGWTDVDYFAYVFDEVDGPNNNGDGSLSRDDYIAFVHDQIARVQAGIDSGSQSTKIDLLWTSHSNPSIWKDDPLLDLTGIVRLWAPNASAADTDFLRERVASGEKAWFYHSGHPAIGAHSINVSGIEMRTWGVVGARYGLQGQLMWAVNLGSDEFPYRDPQFNIDENRAGNGVMVYPGNRLDRIGYDKSPGPVPSMRLKSWRRGLQDAELYLLALENNPVAANRVIRQQIPSALTEGQGSASWSSIPADWINFHRQLLELATQ